MLSPTPVISLITSSACKRSHHAGRGAEHAGLRTGWRGAGRRRLRETGSDSRDPEWSCALKVASWPSNSVTAAETRVRFAK